ncbi:MAG: hypothetical protein K1X67_11450 [Fimbriimonadaceae bacterium]|nr:hypothetical protein [Fimbriimonadaceae bacterium]
MAKRMGRRESFEGGGCGGGVPGGKWFAVDGEGGSTPTGHGQIGGGLCAPKLDKVRFGMIGVGARHPLQFNGDPALLKWAAAY